MSVKPIISAAEAAKFVQDGMTFVTTGFVACEMPESLNKALEKSFLETGHPRDLTLFYAAAQGNRDGSGADHFAHEGMLKRVIGGHYNMVPELGKLIFANKLEAYNLPQGTLSELCRDIAAHKIGTITHVGMNTFCDPRLQGGKLNDVTKEDLVEVVNIAGEERLLYKAFPLQVGFLRGTFADENGNVTLERECCTNEATSIAAAVHNSGGKVVVQVEKVVAAGTLDPRLVKIPGIYVDAIVIAEAEEDQAQCQGTPGFDPSMTGEIRIPMGAIPAPKLSAKKIMGRRAAMELEADKVVNLGIGAPEFVSAVANAATSSAAPSTSRRSWISLISSTSTMAAVLTLHSSALQSATRRVTSTFPSSVPVLQAAAASSTSLRTPRRSSTSAPSPQAASRSTARMAS